MTTRPSRRDGDAVQGAHLTEDELSAYINAEITESDALERFRAHVDECAACRERLEGMRTVVLLLNRSNQPVPSRSFKLEPSMLAPAPAAIDPWIIRIQPVARRLTAIAAALLLVIVVADVVAHQGSSVGNPPSSRNVTTSVQTTSGGAQSFASSAGATAAATAASAAPAVVESGSAPTSDSQKSATEAPQAAPITAAAPQTHTRLSYWRLLELAVGVVVVWLLFMSVALPRIRG